MIENLLEFLSFSHPNVRFVTFGSVLIGVVLAITGCFTFLRKQALTGDSIAHSVLPGICLAFIVAQTKNPLYLLIGAFLSGWISLFYIEFIETNSKLKSDTAIAVTLSSFFGFGMLLLTSIQHSRNAAQAGLDSYLFGKAAAMNFEDVLLISIVTLFIGSISFLFYNQFKLLSFNPDFAKVIGMPIKLYKAILTGITVLAISVGIQAVGVILIAALLIAPAACARLWTNKLPIMILMAILFGACAGFFGALTSFLAPAMPTGPWIVVFLSIIVAFSVTFSPINGWLYQKRRSSKTNRRIAEENVLKAIYKSLENQNDFEQSISISQLLGERKFLFDELTKNIKSLKKTGLLIEKGNAYKFTRSGFAKAKKIVRLHRLWELFLSTKLNFKEDHVHYDAEAMEHIITPEIEQMLEEELKGNRMDPHGKSIPI